MLVQLESNWIPVKKFCDCQIELGYHLAQLAAIEIILIQ